MADPLGTQQLDGCADTFRACSFARVSGDVQTRITGFPENIREELRRAAHLVAADPKREDAMIAVTLPPREHGAHVVHSELTDGIKDPVHPNTSSRLGITRGAGNRFEGSLHWLFFPQQDSHGNCDLRIADVLGCKPFHEPRGDQCIILRPFEQQ